MRKLSRDTAIVRMKAAMPDYDYRLFEYEGSQVKSVVVCQKHGEFLTSYDKIVFKHGCPTCYNDRRHLNTELSQETAVSRMYQARPAFDYSQFVYSGSSRKGVIVCSLHGAFKASYDSIIGGHGCPGCKADNTSKRHTISHEHALDKMTSVAPQYNYSQFRYRGSDTPSVIICSSHGEFTSTYHCIVSGRGCPKCGIERRTALRTLDSKLAIQRMSNCMPQYDYSRFEYKTSSSKGEVVCALHGSFLTSYNFIVNGTGCPDCCAGGFNPKRRSVFYLYKIIKNGVPYLGYGITGNMGKRNTDHQASFHINNATGELLCVFRFRRGYACKALEDTINDSFEVIDIGIPGFKRETTNWSNYHAVLKTASDMQMRFGSVDSLDTVSCS